MTNLLDIITPINLSGEQDKFFSSSTYNPTFHYQWQGTAIDPHFSIEKKYPLWQAIRDQNHERIVRTAADLFEVNINEMDVKEADRTARMKGKVQTGSADEYARLMYEAFNEFDLSDFEVVITDATGFNSRPDHKNKRLVISRSIHFEYFSLEGGVHHEIVHILRYCNGKANGVKRSQRFLPTEEGLASWCQDHANDDNGQAQHAMEYVASAVGLRGSLRDVYEAMRDMGMSKELAWKRACRHKFGFVNTSAPGDILKPAMYYANEIKVDKLGSDERVRLFVGKINQDELNDYPAYQGLWSPEKIITYFHL